MSHHGSRPFKDEDGKKLETFKSQNERMRELLDATGFRGALGTYPQGQLTKQDEGAIQFAIGSKGDKVIIDFGTSVHWLGMSPQEAMDLASTLMKRAREVARRNGESVSVTIG